MKMDNKTHKARAASLERLHNLLPHRAEPLFELITVYKTLEQPDQIAISEAKLDAWRTEHGTKSDEWVDHAELWNLTDWDPLITLAVDFEVMGHGDIADELCHLALLDGIPSEDLNMQRADCLASQGQLKRALVYWRRIYELNNENPMALFSLAQFYLWEDDPSSAIEFLERLHQIRDDNAIGTQLAAAYVEAGRFEDVERLLPTLGLNQAEEDDFAAEIGILRNTAEGRGDEPVGKA